MLRRSIPEFPAPSRRHSVPSAPRSEKGLTAGLPPCPEVLRLPDVKPPCSTCRALEARLFSFGVEARQAAQAGDAAGRGCDRAGANGLQRNGCHPHPIPPPSKGEGQSIAAAKKNALPP